MHFMSSLSNSPISLLPVFVRIDDVLSVIAPFHVAATRHFGRNSLDFAENRDEMTSDFGTAREVTHSFSIEASVRLFYFVVVQVEYSFSIDAP